MKRLLAVLVGAGIAVGGSAAAWAGTGGDGANREAVKTCVSQAKSDHPGPDKAAVKAAAKSCLAAKGIAPKGHAARTPEQQAKREALKTCLKDMKAANPGADRTALRAAATPCLEKAGITPGQVANKMAAVKECVTQAKAAAGPGADKAKLRSLVKGCVHAKK